MSPALQITASPAQHYVRCEFGQSRLGGDGTDAEVWQQVAQAARPGWVRRVVLDFSQVRILTSAALGKLLLLNKKLAGQDRQLCVCGLNPRLRDILHVTHLHRVLKIADSIAECVADAA